MALKEGEVLMNHRVKHFYLYFQSFRKKATYVNHVLYFFKNEFLKQYNPNSPTHGILVSMD